MPSFTLTPEEIKSLHVLPGHALIKTSPAELIINDGLLVLPESAAVAREEALAVRKGVIISLNRWGKGGMRVDDNAEDYNNVEDYSCKPCWDDPDSSFLLCGQMVYYWGHQDEMDNQYVVVKLGQIVAVKLDLTTSVSQ